MKSHNMKQSRKTNLYLYFLVWIQIIGVAVFVNPENTAVVSGTPLSYLNCSNPSSNSSLFSWSVTLLYGSSFNIVSGCTTQASTPQYGTEKPTNDSCNLIIYNASPSLAGKYSCNPQFGSVSSAEFIVLDGNPVCSTSPTGDVPEGQAVEMSCGTNVYGNMKPTMTWYNGAQQVQSPQVNNSNYIGSTISVQATIPNVPSYMCNTTFGAPTIPPGPGFAGSATNPPGYSWQCNTPRLPVLYAPVNVSISLEGNEDPTDLPCYTQLTCSANGYPSAEYTWYLPPINSTTSESTVSASQSGIYACRASNTQGSDSSSVTINVQHCPTTTTTMTTATPLTSSSGAPGTLGSSSTNVGAIIGGIIGGILGSAIIILGLCFLFKSCPLYKKYRPDRSSKGKKAVSTNAGDLTNTFGNIPVGPVQEIYADIDQGGSTPNDGYYSKLNRGANYYENQDLHNYEQLSSPKYVNVQTTETKTIY